MSDTTLETGTRSTRDAQRGAAGGQAGNGNGNAARSTRERVIPRPYSSSTKFAEKKVPYGAGDMESALQEQLQDARYTELRADLGAQYLENLPLPSYGDLAVPGYKLIPNALANEYGLAGLGEDEDFDFDFPPDEPTPEAAAAVDGNLIHTFVDGIKGQHLFDTLNATLLAQLAANFKYNRRTDPVNWTEFYGGVLENIGWLVPRWDFREVTTHATQFTLDSAIIKILTSILTADQIDLVKNALASLQELNKDDRRLTIWRQNSASSSAGTFQITGVGESAAGILQMGLSAMHFNTDESVTDVFVFRFSRGSTNIRATRSTLVLNDQVYDRLRDAVIDKLGNRGLKYIARLELGDEPPPE